MKRLLTIIITLICATSCGILSLSHYSPYIDLDRMEEYGTRRQIMSKGVEYSLDGADYNFCVKVFEYDSHRDWLLLISSFSQIPNDGTLLIKLGNDEVLTLPVNNVHVGDIDVSGLYGYYKIVDHYSSVYVMYQSYFDKIKEHGIKKIRISTAYSFRDKTFIGNGLGNHITKCKEHIDKRLATTRHKSINEDF